MNDEPRDPSDARDPRAATDPYDPQESSHAQDASDARHRVERILRETIRRGLEKGLGTWARTDRALRGVVDEAKLPREIVGYVFSQIDETKSMLARVVGREVRDFLEHADLNDELRRLLTSLSFEIRTEVRFIPNDAGGREKGQGGLRPEVRTKVAPKKSAQRSTPRDDE